MLLMLSIVYAIDGKSAYNVLNYAARLCEYNQRSVFGKRLRFVDDNTFGRR